MNNADPQKSTHLPEGAQNAISEVIVFSDQAYVTRRAGASVGAGLERIHVEIHPFSLDKESAQAHVYGKGELLSVQYAQIPVDEEPQEKVRELEEQKRDLQYQIDKLKDSGKVIEKQRGFLDSLVNFSGTEIPKRLKTSFPSTDSLHEMVTFIGEQLGDLSGKDEVLKKERDKLSRQFTALESRLKQLHKGKIPTRKVIEVLFESAQAQDLVIEVSYLVQQAGWTPVYRADVADSLDDLTLALFARIQQRTGEDWRDCKVSVSNAAPARGDDLPEPDSWYLRPPETRQVMRRKSMDLGAVAAAAPQAGGDEMAVLEDFDSLEAGGAEPAEYRQASAREQLLAVEYELSQPVSVPADGSDSLLPLTRSRLQGDCFHYASPKLDPAVYLVCRAELAEELLPGRLNVHFGGRFVNSTHIGETAAGEELLLNLGPDRAVKATRRMVSDKLKETLFGKMDRSTVAKEMFYKTLIENRRGEGIVVHLLDAVPVSKTDRYAIKGLELKPEPDERDWKDREGVMLWKQKIDPGAISEFSMRFQIKYPRDLKPQGM